MIYNFNMTHILYTIYILWLRQIKRYFRSKSRIVGSLGQPILFLLALGYGLGPVFSQAGQGNYFQFLAPGVIAMGILFTSIFSGIEIIWDRQFGFLKETLVAPVSRLVIMIGRTLGGATTAMFQGVIVLVIAIIAGFRPELASIPEAILIMLCIALLFAAAGTALASRLEDMQGFQLITNFIIMPIFFLSGALFPLTGLPPAVAFLVHINPLTYGVDALRHVLAGATQFSLVTDVSVLVCVTAAFLVIGAYTFSKIKA